MMSEKRRQPTETVALNAHRAGLEENQQKALTSIFQKGGLFSFSRVPVRTVTSKARY
jgi:conjugal transfer pilus assembly protein TraF